MLISHTLKYLPAQLLSPAAQLVSMILWTHWLSPAEMGTFTLVTVTQEVAYTFCLGWFSLYALRYLPSGAQSAERDRYLGTENVVVLASIGAGMLAAIITTWTLGTDYAFGWSALAIGAFFGTRAINMHYGERARAQSAFFAYTILQVSGPVGGLALGLLAFQYVDATALSLLFAYALAQLIGSLVSLPMLGMHWRFSKPDPGLLRAAIGFGAPMLGLNVLGWVAENYIRYLVQWESGAVALGLMIVGWSLGRRCAAVASMLVATAAFPLAARLLNEGKRAEALGQLRTNAALLLAVLVPVAVALQQLGPALMSLAVAAEYRETTIQLLGLAVFAGALRNLHVHVTDQVMVLERHLGSVALIDLLEIGACAVCSLVGLRQYGLHGAVIGQMLGSALTLCASIYWARRRQGFVWPLPETVKILVATGVMYGALVWIGGEQNLSGLLMGTLLGTSVYVLAMAVLFSRDLQRWRMARA